MKCPVLCFEMPVGLVWAFPGGSDGKRMCLQCRRPRLDPWVRKIPWRRKWQPTPVFLPGKSHGWRSLAGYSPWGHMESDAIEQLHFFTSSWVWCDFGQPIYQSSGLCSCVAGELAWHVLLWNLLPLAWILVSV